MKLNEEQINKLKFECNTCFINEKHDGQLLLSDNYKLLDQGSFAQCYTDYNVVLKKYFSNPHLDSSETGKVVFTYKDVIDNLINISKIKQDSSAIPYKFYVKNNDLVMYKQPFMKGEQLNAISYLKMNKDLSEIKSAWYFAYFLASYYADKKIVMYDLNPSNCNIFDGRLLIYDLDFYRKEDNSDTILLDNYEIVNECFEYFFKLYYIDFEYKTSLNNYFQTSFCDDFFDEFNDHLKCPSKTLVDAYKNMHSKI